MPTPRRWCPSWAEKPRSPVGTKSSYRRRGQRRSPPLRRGRMGRLGPGYCVGILVSWCSHSGSPCLGRTGQVQPHLQWPGAQRNTSGWAGKRYRRLRGPSRGGQCDWNHQGGVGGTEAGTFRKAPGEGKGLLETRSKRWVDITGGRDPILGTVFMHIHCVPGQVIHPNSTCVMGTPAMAPTHRMMVNWDRAIQVLSLVPDPQSVSCARWH